MICLRTHALKNGLLRSLCDQPDMELSTPSTGNVTLIGYLRFHFRLRDNLFGTRDI